VLLALGLVMIAEAFVSLAPLGILPHSMIPRIPSGLALGLVIGPSAGSLEGMNDETTVDITAYVLQVNGAKAGAQPSTRTTGVIVSSITR
jgi:hypothetical protein